MAKAASPIRLQKDLMASAELAAKRFHRSTAEQIEYWASLGQSVSSALNPDVLLSIKTGLAKLNVEPVVSSRLDPAAVFSNLEAQQETGSLTEAVTSNAYRYQSSSRYPGWLERVDSQGQALVGQFVNGKFISRDDA